MAYLAQSFEHAPDIQNRPYPESVSELVWSYFFLTLGGLQISATYEPSCCLRKFASDFGELKHNQHRRNCTSICGPSYTHCAQSRDIYGRSTAVWSVSTLTHKACPRACPIRPSCAKVGVRFRLRRPISAKQRAGSRRTRARQVRLCTHDAPSMPAPPERNARAAPGAPAPCAFAPRAAHAQRVRSARARKFACACAARVRHARSHELRDASRALRARDCRHTRCRRAPCAARARAHVRLLPRDRPAARARDPETARPEAHKCPSSAGPPGSRGSPWPPNRRRDPRVWRRARPAHPSGGAPQRKRRRTRALATTGACAHAPPERRMQAAQAASAHARGSRAAPAGRRAPTPRVFGTTRH